VTSAWSIDSRGEREAVLLGVSAASQIYHPEKPVHARTPFDPPNLSGFGKISTCTANGSLSSGSQPQHTFFGAYGDTWSEATIEKNAGSRGSKKHGVFGANVGGQGITERAPGPVTPGPGAHELLRPGIDAASGRQVKSTQRTAPRAFITNETSLDEKQDSALKAFLAEQRSPGPLDYHTGPTRDIPHGLSVSDSTIGGALPTSTLLGTPQFSFTSKPEPRFNGNPGPGAHRFDAFKTLSGAAAVVSESTLGRTITRQSAPVAVMQSRDPKHPARRPKAGETESKKEDFRSNQSRWTSRVRLSQDGEIPTDLRMPVYSSFGGQKAGSQSAAYTIRALHVNRSRTFDSPGP